MCDGKNPTPEQQKDVHYSGSRNLEDDDELYEFDDLCIKNPEEVIGNVDDSKGKPEGSFCP